MSNFKGMTSENIKKAVEELYGRIPDIHINLNRARKKLSNVQVTIKGLYSNFFIVEHNDCGYVSKYTVRYDELLTSEIEILELA